MCITEPVIYQVIPGCSVNVRWCTTIYWVIYSADASANIVDYGFIEKKFVNIMVAWTEIYNDYL